MRRVGVALVVVIVGVVVVTLGLYGWLCTSGGNTWLLTEAMRRAAPKTGSMTATSLDTDLRTHLRLEGVSIRGPNGEERVAADVIEAWFSLAGLPGKLVVVRRMEVHGVRVALDGGDFDGMWPSSGAVGGGWKGIGVDIVADEILADGTVRVREWGGSALALSGKAGIRGKVIKWEGAQLGGVVRGWPIGVTASGSWDGARLDLNPAVVGLGPSRLEAHGGLDGDAIAVSVDAAHLDAPGLVAVIPALSRIRGAFDVTGAISGTLGDPVAALAVRTPGGDAELAGHFAIAEEKWAVSAEPHSLDLGAFSEVAATVDGTAAVEGQGLSWPAGITAHATADAVVTARGERLDLHAIADLAEGIVSATEVRAGVDGAALSGAGSVDLVAEAGTANVTGARLDLARIPRAGLRGTARFSGNVAGSWARDVVVGSAEGVLIATNVSARGVTVASATGPIHGEWDGKAGEGSAELTIAGIGGKGFHVDGAAVSGTAGWDGAARAAVTGTVTGVRVDRFTAASGALTAGISDGVARADVTLSDPDRTVLSLAGDYTVAEGDIRITTLEASPIAGMTWSGEGEQRIRIVPDGVEAVHARLRTASASVAVDGEVHREGRSQLVVAIEGFDVGELATLLPEQFAGYAGHVDVHAGITGPPSRLLMEGQVSAVGLTVPGAIEAVDLSLAGAVSEGNAHVDGELRKGGRLAALTLDAPLAIAFTGVSLDEQGPLRASVLLPPADSARWADALHRPLPTFRASGELRLGGNLRSPTLGLTLSGAVPAGEVEPIWLRGDLDVEVVDDVATVRGGLEEGFLPRAQIGGTFAARLGKVVAWLQGRSSKPDLAMVVGDLGVALLPTQLPLSAIRPFAVLPEGIAGELNGAVLLTGEVASPLVQGGVNLSNARIGALPVDVASAEVHPDGEGYAGRVHLELGDGKLDIEGHVPVTKDGALDLRVSAAAIPLAAAVGVVPGVTAASGDVSLAGAIRGTLAKPAPDVRFGSVGAAFTLATTGVEYRDVTVVGAVTPTHIRIDRLDVTTPAPAAGDVGGSAHLEVDAGWGEDARIGGKVRLSGFWVLAQNDRRVQVSGDLTLSGSSDALRVDGELGLDTGRIRLPERMFGGDRSRRLDPAITVVRGGGIEKEEAVAGTLVPPWLVVDVAVDLRRKLFLEVTMPLQGDYGVVAQWASTLDVSTQIDGTLDVGAKGGGLSIAGTIEPQRGTLDVLGKTFAIETGSVAFTGRDWRTPVLDLRAGFESDDHGKVDVVVSGTADDPTIDFVSDEYGRDDAFAIVTLGAPLGELGGDQGESTTEVMAVSAALSLLKSNVSGITAFSRLELVEFTESGERGGFSLGKDIFVTVEHSSTADDISENAFGITFEYRTPSKWYLDLSTGSAGVSRFGALRRWRF